MATDSTYFSEKQKFKQLWLWILLTGIVILFAYFNYQQLIVGEPVGTNPAPDAVLILTLVLMAGLMFLFLNLKLITEIRDDGIYYRFAPFHSKFRHIPWSDIESIEVTKYKPIGDYLGWGIRSSPSGRAYSVQGNQGLQLVLVDGKRVLIGTKRAEELRQVIAEHAGESV